MTFPKDDLRLMANALRLLALDGIEHAGSGHPGMPLGMADVVSVLAAEVLRFHPEKPEWTARDRLVLSAGHGSMLLYALLHLTGSPAMTKDQLAQFRRFGSLTPGHPEAGHTPGVEVTTGPLAQGLANGVGMALAERVLVSEFGEDLAGHHTYVIVGDGCLMEGLSQEAISLAGHLGLGRLIVLFDDNGITIDGPTSLSTSEDQSARFKACGWHVQAVDGHDADDVRLALSQAMAETARPSLIACRTTIGYGAPTKAGTAAVHGSPLGGMEAQGTRQALGGEALGPFEVEPRTAALWRLVAARGMASWQAWEKTKASIDSDVLERFAKRMSRALPDGWEKAFLAEASSLFESPQALATRVWSGKVLEVLERHVPGLLGGSADLTPSNNTAIPGGRAVTAEDFSGRYVHYGIREHGMMAAMNGMASHGGFVPYGGTFLVFSDYLRPALRLAALSKFPVICVLTHDSIGLGEDGPTHQPIEHLASLRAMPNLHVMRPGCGVEVAECWALAVASTQTPSAIALSRQAVPMGPRRLDPDHNLCARGGYTLCEAAAVHRVTLLATGSEVALALEVRQRLEASGIGCRVVSLPVWSLFDQQPLAYREQVLSTGQPILRVALEAASPFGWERYVGTDGLVCGIASFGASAPGSDLYEAFGLTVPQVLAKIQARFSSGGSVGV